MGALVAIEINKKNLVLVLGGMLLVLGLMNLAFAAKPKMAKMSKKHTQRLQEFSNTPVEVLGKYKKHDKKYVYLNVKGTSNLIKIEKKYLLNSPSFLNEGELVSVQVPIGRYLTDNYKPKTKN